MLENRETHPSYATLSFSRAQSGMAIPLFGSSIKHRDTIIMRVSEAELCRELNSDHIFSGKRIVEVEMSQSQFAEAITSMNMGSGVPVTLRFRADKPGLIEQCPYEDKIQKFEKEFAECQEESKQHFKEFVNQVKTLLEKKSLGKGDKEEIIKNMDILYGRVFSNQEFVYKQFNEQMDKTVTEAKGEIEAFVQNKMNSIAREALVNGSETILLENPVAVD